MTTSKVVSADHIGEWSNGNGLTLQKIRVRFENDFQNTFLVKDANNHQFKIGAEITYKDNNGKIEIVKENNFRSGGGGIKSEPYEHKIAGFSLSYSKDLLIAGKIEDKNLFKVADKMYDWLLSKKVS